MQHIRRRPGNWNRILEHAASCQEFSQPQPCPGPDPWGGLRPRTRLSWYHASLRMVTIEERQQERRSAITGDHNRSLTKRPYLFEVETSYFRLRAS